MCQALYIYTSAYTCAPLCLVSRPAVPELMSLCSVRNTFRGILTEVEPVPAHDVVDEERFHNLHLFHIICICQEIYLGAHASELTTAPTVEHMAIYATSRIYSMYPSRPQIPDQLASTKHKHRTPLRSAATAVRFQ